MDIRVMKRFKEEGFTLIEVLVAVVILAIGIFALTSMQTTGIKGNATANSISTAGTWASDRVEQIFAMPYDDLVDVGGDGTNEDADDNGVDDDGGNFGLGNDTVGTADGSFVSPDGFYSVFWNVAVDEPMPHLKNVRIIVKKMDDKKERNVFIDYKKAEFMN